MSLPVNRGTNYGIGVACVVFLIIAGWYGQSVLSDLSSYNDWDKPAEVAKLLKGGVWGGVGFLLALGVNFFDIVRPVIAVIPGLQAYAGQGQDQAPPPAPPPVQTT